MFSALNQGSLIYILDKTDGIKLKIGTITSISAPRTNYNPTLNQINQQVVDIKCQVDGINQEYNSIPSTYSLVSYNNGKLIISETKQSLTYEVETSLQAAQQVIDNIDTYKQNVVDCENILKELNPQFAKDQERDTRLNSLEEKFENVENKLDKVLTLITTKQI